MKINNHEPITKRNDVNTGTYSQLLIVRKTASMKLISFFDVSLEIFLKINVKKFIY